MKKNNVFLLCILILAAVLRFYMLGAVPNGLYQDETAIGYNAYSLLQTGRDEHGVTFPLYFKSFGDYKLPIYIYLSALSIKIFGLNAWAVRFPSAFFGTLTVLMFYVFLKKFFRNQQAPTISVWGISLDVASVAAFLLAINPWHLHYTRATFEVSVSLFLFLAGAHLLQIGSFFLGTVCFIAALYSYNLTRLLSPLLFLLCIWVFRTSIRKKEIAPTVVISVVLLIPFLLSIAKPGGAGSAGGTLLFTSAAVQAPLLEFRSYLVHLPTLFTKVFFNQFFLTAWQYLHNIARYISVEFLFLTGSSHGNHGIGNAGQMYFFELPLILLGIRKNILLIGWLSITILIASLTREAPHATRSFFLLLPLVTFSALGTLKIMQWVAGRRLTTLVAFAFVFYSILSYFTSYYIRFPLYYAKQWRSADKELALFLAQKEQSYDRIVIDPGVGLVYTSILFYQKYPPEEFLRTVKRDSDDTEGFSAVTSFGKFEFRPVRPEDLTSPRTLAVTSPDHVPQGVQPTKEILYPPRPVVLSVKERIAAYPVTDRAYVIIETSP